MGLHAGRRNDRRGEQVMTTDAERLADWLEADACDLQTPRQAAALLRSQAAELKRLQDYDTRLSAVMPADYKDWHEGSKRERPELAAESIKMWRDRANEAYVEIERANALLRKASELFARQHTLSGVWAMSEAKDLDAAIKQHLGEV